MKFQYTIFLLALFLLAIPAQAITLYAPERVPAFTPFTFQALLPPTENFTNATLTFDGRNVATVYPNGQCQVDGEWIAFALKCDTFDADPKTTQGMTLVFTHTGFSRGAHVITIASTGPQSETQTITLNVIDAIDVQVADDLNALMQQLGTSMEGIQSENITAQENANATQAELGARVDTLQTDLSNAKQTLQRVQEEIIPKENTGFQFPFGQPSSPGTGFAVGNSAPLIGLVIVVIAIGAFMFMRKQKQNGMGSGGGNRKNSFFDGNFDAVFKNAQLDSENMEPRPRKFATLGGSSTGERELREEVERNPPEKLHFGDLIKSERD